MSQKKQMDLLWHEAAPLSLASDPAKKAAQPPAITDPFGSSKAE